MEPQVTRLKVSSPVRPFHVNQQFGANLPCVKDYGLPTQEVVTGADNNTCPVGFEKLYSKFGMSGHDGTDLQAGEQNVYASCDGVVIEKQMIASRGLGLGIVTNEPVELDGNGIHYAKIRFWHLKSFNVEVGDIVTKGQLIGISDNTGFSSGSHLHWELVPMDKDTAGHYIATFPNNGYAGAIDIMPFYDGTYADLSVAQEQLSAVSTLVSHITPNTPNGDQQIGLVEKILELIRKELNL